MTSTLLSFISLALALCTTSLAALPRSPLSKRDLQQFSHSVLFSRQGYEGFFLNIDVEGEAVPAQIDLLSSDLFVTGNLQSLDKTAGTTVKANISLPFLNPPVLGPQEVIVGNVTIGGSPAGHKQPPASLAFAFDTADNQGLAHTIPQSTVHAVLGLGASRSSAVAKTSIDFSPLDNLCIRNSANPFVTLLYSGVDNTKPTDSPLVAGFFSVSAPLSTDALFPNNPLSKKLPDLSRITQRRAVTLNGGGAFTVPGIFVNGKALPISNPGAVPSNAALAVLSSTSKYSFVPKDIAHGIYGNASGSSFDASRGLYRLPCDTEITILVQIGSGETTIPLDPQTVVIPDESINGKCVGSFKVLPHDIAGAQHIYGLTFLKNAYVLLGYQGSNGQDLDTAILKMLPLTDPKEAHADFIRVRGSSSGSTGNTASGNVELAGNISDDNNSTSSSDNTSNGPTGSVAEQLKHCLPAIIVLAIVVGLVLIGSVIFCVVGGRRNSGGKASAYRSLHDAETSAHSKGLYAHDEETKYSTPYTDSH